MQKTMKYSFIAIVLLTLMVAGALGDNEYCISAGSFGLFQPADAVRKGFDGDHYLSVRISRSPFASTQCQQYAGSRKPERESN